MYRVYCRRGVLFIVRKVRFVGGKGVVLAIDGFFVGGVLEDTKSTRLVRFLGLLARDLAQFALLALGGLFALRTVEGEVGLVVAVAGVVVARGSGRGIVGAAAFLVALVMALDGGLVGRMLRGGLLALALGTAGGLLPVVWILAALLPRVANLAMLGAFGDVVVVPRGATLIAGLAAAILAAGVLARAALAIVATLAAAVVTSTAAVGAFVAVPLAALVLPLVVEVLAAALLAALAALAAVVGSGLATRVLLEQALEGAVGLVLLHQPLHVEGDRIDRFGGRIDVLGAEVLGAMDAREGVDEHFLQLDGVGPGRVAWRQHPRVAHHLLPAVAVLVARREEVLLARAERSGVGQHRVPRMRVAREGDDELVDGQLEVGGRAVDVVGQVLGERFVPAGAGDARERLAHVAIHVGVVDVGEVGRHGVEVAQRVLEEGLDVERLLAAEGDDLALFAVHSARTLILLGIVQVVVVVGLLQLEGRLFVERGHRGLRRASASAAAKGSCELEGISRSSETEL